MRKRRMNPCDESPRTLQSKAATGLSMGGHRFCAWSVVAADFAANVTADVPRGDISNANTANPMTTCAAIFADGCEHVVGLLRRRNGHGLCR